MSEMSQNDRIEAKLDIIFEKLDGSIGMQPTNVKHSVLSLFSAMLDYRKIDAIKEYRHLTGDTLKGSKDAVEAVMNLMVRS